MRVIADHARTTAFLIARGRDARSHRARVRAAARDAARDPPRAPAWASRSRSLHQVALDAWTSRWATQYPELRERRELIASVTEAEEVRFRADHRARPAACSRSASTAIEAREPEDAARRGRVQAVRHLRLPARSDGGDLVRSAASASTRRATTRPWKEARKRSEFKGVEQAVEGVYREARARVPWREACASPATSATRTKARSSRWSRAARWWTSVDEGDTVELVTEQDAVLRRPRAARSATSGVVNGGTRSSVVGRGHAEADHGPGRARGPRRNRQRSRSGTSSELAVDVAAARAHAPQPLGDPPLALGAAAGGRPARAAEGVAGRPGALALRLHAPARRSRPSRSAKVEELVNERTLGNHPIRTEVLPMEEARTRGAMMIFEEKYGDVVRMLSMAESTRAVRWHARARDGRHRPLQDRGRAGHCRGRSPHRRRHGRGARSDTCADLEKSIARTAEIARTTRPRSSPRRWRSCSPTSAASRSRSRICSASSRAAVAAASKAGSARARDVNGVKVLGVRTEVTDRSALRELAEQLRDKLGESIVLVGSAHEGKAQLVLTVSKALNARFRAGRPDPPHRGDRGRLGRRAARHGSGRRHRDRAPGRGDRGRVRRRRLSDAGRLRRRRGRVRPASRRAARR